MRVGGMACGVYADRFGSMKKIALGNSVCATAAFLVFALSQLHNAYYLLTIHLNVYLVDVLFR